MQFTGCEQPVQHSHWPENAITGCHNGNEMRNMTCVDTKMSIEWPYCSFLYCGLDFILLKFITYDVDIKLF